ncbi:MAG: amidohydrolase [Phycisphaerae bacterium]|nr:amidohydrolase [Phycisphaerae bacterium]
MLNKHQFLEAVETCWERAVVLRHRLHRVPEPALGEYKTAEILAEELISLDLSLQTQIAGTGIVAELATGRQGPCVALRADMDALPVEEANDFDYRSQHPGYSHCCGHDGNMAIVLGAARVLASLSDQLCGRVRLIFQPAEEASMGASAMIEAGAIDACPDAILAVHGWPGLAVGSVGARCGAMMAACDVFRITVLGQGGHGARPELARNPLMGVARVIEALSDMNTPERIVSLCQAEVGERPNIISDTGVLSGTIRSLDTGLRAQTLREVVERVDGTCHAVGLKAKVEFLEHTPVVSNDKRLYSLFRRVAGDLLGPRSFVAIETPSMGSEDFGFYLQQVPGLMCRIGVGADSPELHNARFDFADGAVKAGMAVLAGMASMLCADDGPATQ